MDARSAGPVRLASVIRRRSTFQPLARSSDPRWLVMRTVYGAVIEAHRIEPQTDLVRAFLAALLEQIDAGWTAGDFTSSAAVVRLSRGRECRLLTIERQDPSEPVGRGPSPGWVVEE